MPQAFVDEIEQIRQEAMAISREGGAKAGIHAIQEGDGFIPSPRQFESQCGDLSLSGGRPLERASDYFAARFRRIGRSGRLIGRLAVDQPAKSWRKKREARWLPVVISPPCQPRGAAIQRETRFPWGRLLRCGSREQGHGEEGETSSIG